MGGYGKAISPEHQEIFMSRLITAPTIDSAPEASRALLEAVKKQLGMVPNMFRLIGSSSASLEGHLNLSAALGKGKLPAQTRERVALAVAEANGCSYCLSAHTYIGKNLLKLDDAEMIANRNGTSSDAKANAAVHFAAKLVKERGHVKASDVAAVKEAGYDDAQIVEIVLHVALNTFTNYINEVGQTEIDFPVVRPQGM